MCKTSVWWAAPRAICRVRVPALYGLPYGAETSVLAYRRDLSLPKHGFAPPRTYAELSAHAGAPLQLSGPAWRALTSRGQSGHNCVHAWLLHLNALGWPGCSMSAMDAPVSQSAGEGVQALQLLKHIADTGPKGIPLTFRTTTCWLEFSAGRERDVPRLNGRVRRGAQLSGCPKLKAKSAMSLHPQGGAIRLAIRRAGPGDSPHLRPPVRPRFC